MNTVLVHFMNDNGDVAHSKKYAYLCDPSIDLTVDDTVVVEARGFMGIAIVVQTAGLTAEQAGRANRWVICKIDMDTHKANLVKGRLALEIKSKLKKAREDFEERRIYEMLAKDDPKIAELLVEYQKLTNTQLTSGQETIEDDETKS